jgi:hypothetical protein
MRPRDRLVAAAVAALILIGGMWVLLVSPERGKVATLDSLITNERSALAAAETQIASGRRAVAAYVGHLRQIDDVIRAVPQTPAEADVVATIDKLAGTKVDFRELDVSGASASATGPASFGLTFSFWTTYKGLQSFLTALDGLTSTDGTNVNANGRLFTVSSVSMSPLNSPTLAPMNVTKATITAQAYVQGGLGATTGATGGAATGATTGATGATGATAVTG